MKDNQTGKRIGFALNSIHFGASLTLWRRLANYAAQKNGSFFIFPGGRLDKTSNTERLRNSIFSLVNSENLDGVISWASSMGSDVPEEDMLEFHRKLGNLPYVTIGQKILNHPDVAFDAYSGMKDLTRHFIQVHGTKKIAFKAKNYELFCIFAPNFNDLYEVYTEIQRFSTYFAGSFALSSTPSAAFHLRQRGAAHTILHHPGRRGAAGVDDEARKPLLSAKPRCGGSA
jgi:DNA-binding LacI/PurR family transcriptional regulator